MDDGCGCFLIVCAVVLLLFVLTALGMYGDYEAQQWARNVISGN